MAQLVHVTLNPAIGKAFTCKLLLAFFVDMTDACKSESQTDEPLQNTKSETQVTTNNVIVIIKLCLIFYKCFSTKGNSEALHNTKGGNIKAWP